MTHKFANMTDDHDPYLNLSRVDLVMIADGRELDTFFCNSARDAQFGDKITVSENGVFSPLNLNCWIKCETTKLSQVIPDYPGKEIEIDVHGKIQFVVGTTKIDKVIEAEESIKFKSKRERIVV